MLTQLFNCVIFLSSHRRSIGEKGALNVSVYRMSEDRAQWFQTREDRNRRTAGHPDRPGHEEGSQALEAAGEGCDPPRTARGGPWGQRLRRMRRDPSFEGPGGLGRAPQGVHSRQLPRYQGLAHFRGGMETAGTQGPQGRRGLILCPANGGALFYLEMFHWVWLDGVMKNVSRETILLPHPALRDGVAPQKWFDKLTTSARAVHSERSRTAKI